MIFLIGLALIVIGWIAQVYRTLAMKEKKLSIFLLLPYTVGCALLTSGNFLQKDVTTGVLNALCVVLGVILLIVLMSRKKTGRT
jgi:uncharacterized membrane protein